MNKYRNILLVILIIITSNAYCQNGNLKDSIFGNLQRNQIKELSFRMFYFTKSKTWDYGNVYLKGRLKKGKFTLFLIELKTTKKGNSKWIKHPIKLSTEVEDYLLKQIDDLFISIKVRPVQSITERDVIIFSDRNSLDVKIKRNGGCEHNDYEFGDYSLKQINESEDVVYSPQMITLFKTIEDIIKTKVEELQVITIKDNGKNI